MAKTICCHHIHTNKQTALGIHSYIQYTLVKMSPNPTTIKPRCVKLLLTEIGRRAVTSRLSHITRTICRQSMTQTNEDDAHLPGNHLRKLKSCGVPFHDITDMWSRFIDPVTIRRSPPIQYRSSPAVTTSERARSSLTSTSTCTVHVHVRQTFDRATCSVIIQ